MRPLPRIFRKNGFTYTMVLSNGRSAVYKQEVTPNKEYYEVFLILVKPEKEIFGKTIPEREVFPGNEEFGSTAWSYDDLGKAIIKLIDINS